MATLRGAFAIFLLLLLMAPSSLRAGHLYGGAITWDCLGSGEYVFYLIGYRDCDVAGALNPGQIDVDNHPSVSSILLSRDTAYDISPDCQEVPGSASEIDCSSGGGGAIEKLVFSSSPITLSGTPPADGWIFSWSGQTRSTGPTNLKNSGAQGLTLRSKMFETPGGNDPCQDASPRPQDPPIIILCSENQVKWNGGAMDPDADSLSYSWATAYGKKSGGSFNPPSDPSPLSYENGFSADKPFSGIQAGTGSAADRLDPKSGELTLQNPSQGDYNYVLKISSWRAGQKIAEVYHESGLVVSDCPSGTSSPEILPPFGNSFSDTFQVGQTVNVPIRAVDKGVLQDGSQQTIGLRIEGAPFGKDYNDPTVGCQQPPCATLSPSPPNRSTDTVRTELQWDLDCSHFTNSSRKGSGRYRRFDFHISAFDDHCSVPGYAGRQMSIYIENRGPVPPPSLNCIDRQAGDLQLSWTPPSGSHPSFDGYVIYRSSDEGGPYTPIDTVSGIATDSYSDPGQASGPDRYYYIRSLSGCQGKLRSKSSDTLQRLDLTVSDPNNGEAQLSWNELAVSDQAPNNGTGYYRILKEYPLGTWQVIDSVPYGTTNYQDTITVCSDSLTYRVEIADHQRNCISSSNTDGGVFEDVLAPSVPEINKVSVDTSIGKATIDWEAVPQKDAQGYLVLQIIGGTEYVIDTVWGRTNTFYTHSGSNAQVNSEKFAIAAFDSCYSGTPPRPNTSTRGRIHNSMNLKGEKNECERTTELSWNPYRNWEGGVSGYRVYFIEKGSSPVYVGRTKAGDTTMTHGEVPLNERYCYVVQAVSENGTVALSDKECFRMDFPDLPDSHYLASASVLPQNRGIVVRSLPDTSSSSTFFRLERAAPQDSFEKVKKLPWNGDPVFSIRDTSVNPSASEYRYRVIVEDSCGNPLFRSNIGRSIHLRVNADREPPVNVLQWTSYKGWDGVVTSYEIHRIDRKKGIDKKVAEVGPMRRTYEHDVSEGVQEESGRYCYYVLAKESGNPYGRDEVARSNEACAFQEPYIHIPNAYIVNGASESFNAVTGHVPEDGFRLSIYDRWGKQVYSTQDPEEGWKGRTDGGELLPEGVYVYHFVFRTSKGQRIERRGGVTLLHK